MALGIWLPLGVVYLCMTPVDDNDRQSPVLGGNMDRVQELAARLHLKILLIWRQQRAYTLIAYIPDDRGGTYTVLFESDGNRTLVFLCATPWGPVAAGGDEGLGPLYVREPLDLGPYTTGKLEDSRLDLLTAYT